MSYDVEVEKRVSSELKDAFAGAFPLCDERDLPRCGSRVKDFLRKRIAQEIGEGTKHFTSRVVRILCEVSPPKTHVEDMARIVVEKAKTTEKVEEQLRTAKSTINTLQEDCKQWAADHAKQFRKIDELTKQVIELQKLAPSEICAKYQFQDCSHCDRIDCGDNTSPAKQKILELEQEIAGLQETCRNQSDDLAREIRCHGNCLSIAEGVLEWEQAEESSLAIVAVKKLRTDYERLVKALENAQKTADGEPIVHSGRAVWGLCSQGPQVYTVAWCNNDLKFMAYIDTDYSSGYRGTQWEVREVSECYSTEELATEAYKNSQPASPDTDEVEL